MKSQPDGTRRVQWGTASTADTTTGPTDAEPTDTAQTGILGCAGADSQPSLQDRLSREMAARYPLLENPQPFNLHKQGYLVRVIDEQIGLAEVWPVLPLHVEAYSYEVELERKRQRIAGTTARLALAPEALHPIIELHSPNEHEECRGCDGGPDYSGDWPCRTIELILEGLE